MNALGARTDPQGSRETSTPVHDAPQEAPPRGPLVLAHEGPAAVPAVRAPATNAYATSVAPVTAIAAVGTLAAVLLMVATAAAAEPHDPIFIDSDAAFCENGGVSTGVVNCGTANGTAASPYIIEGWEIMSDPQRPQACDSASGAAIFICGTTAHVIIRDVAVRSVGLVTVDGGAWAPHPVGIRLTGAQNVVLDGVTIEASGLALVVEDAPQSAQPSSVLLRASNVGSLTTVPSGLELVRNVNSHLTIQESALDASLRSAGIYSLAAERATDIAPRLVVSDTQLLYPRIMGIQARGGSLLVEGSAIEMDSLPRPSGDDFITSGFEAAAISVIEGADSEIRDSTITFKGTGLSLADAGSLTMRGNILHGGSSLDVAVELSGDATTGGASCDFTVDFNDIGNLVLVNGLPGCTLHAPDNWWGGQGPRQDQLQGAILALTWSPVNLDGMARVELAHEPPARVGQDMVLHGNATGPVERLALSGDVEANLSTEAGPFQWQVPLHDAPLRSLDVRLQACSTEFCGPPVDWVTYRGAASLPPVPVLEADRVVVPLGQPVTFDASGSYSPAGAPVVGYRFDDGPWIAEPVVERSWTDAGSFPVRLHVEDAAGIRSTEPAVIQIHVRSTDGVSAASRDASAAGALAMLAVLSTLALAAPRRFR